MRDGGDSGLATMTAAAYGNFRGRQWRWMMMVLINNGMQELAADNDGEGTRPGGKQRRHMEFNIGNIISK